MAKHQTEAKKIRRLSDEAMSSRLQKMIDLRNEWLKVIEEKGIEYVLNDIRLQQGNDKTGQACWTISLIPIVDCPNCSECSKDCYDIRNDCWMPSVQNDRARNSAVHKVDPKAFWNRVDELVKENFVEQLRINVGGDLADYDFEYVNQLAKNNKGTDILFFTKNYNGINKYLDDNKFCKNVSPMMSRWPGMSCNNKHNLPQTHVLFADGTTTAPEFGATYCGGNCTECHFKKDGCWTTKNDIIFLAH